jgi:hypothetical protein
VPVFWKPVASVFCTAVKQCIGLLKIPFTNIYNASLESGIFPDKLKIAKIVPVHKKGDAKDVQNYRPVHCYLSSQNC